jgi:magnesium transporter
MNPKQLEKLLHKISYYPKKRIEIFNDLKIGQKRDIILKLSKHVQYDIISKISKEDFLLLLEHMDNDEATDLLQLLTKKNRHNIVKELSKQRRSEISLLLKFDPKTAAGLMNLAYIQVEAYDPISSVAKQARVHEKRTGKLPTILIMQTGKLLGHLPGHQLGFARPQEIAKKYLKKLKTVKHNADIDQVINIFENNPHSKIVVMGDRKNVLGIIYSDDILQALHRRESSSLYDFAGVHSEESVFDSTRNKVKSRYKWLIINLGTAFLAAFTVGIFDETITKYVLLAVYMPIVAGMGGNAATQTLAIMVRGITLQQISLGTVWRTLKNELGAGLINGFINGLIVAIIIFLKDGDIRIGLILALAMIINLVIAALFGTTVPLIMKKLGKDPAASATIFITTATDVFGFFAFLGLATLILK